MRDLPLDAILVDEAPCVQLLEVVLVELDQAATSKLQRVGGRVRENLTTPSTPCGPR
jgi:hypothetical protein